MKHALAIVLLLPLFAAPGAASAHCDGLDGPVVAAAQRALDSGDVDLVLVWVRAADAPDIRQAFAQTLAVRTASPEAKALADRYFFETVVRVHRASEGAPYTGLKQAGRDLGPAIPAADKALQAGDVEPLVELLTHAGAHGVREHFAAANAARRYDAHDVAAGRSYVESYVSFIHYVERLYQAATTSPHGHFHEEP